MFYLNLLPSKTLICLCLHLFHFRFYVACCSLHIAGHILCLPYHIIHLTMVDLSRLYGIFFYFCHRLIHIFRGELPHLIQILFLFRNELCCLLEASTSHLFFLLKFSMHLVFHFRYLVVGIKPFLYHCIRLFSPCLSQLLLHTMHILPPVLTFSLHHLFLYVKLFMVGVNVTLVI